MAVLSRRASRLANSRSALRRCTTALAALALAASSATASAAAAPTALEYAVKANFLYKFAPFVAWPPTAFAAADSPFVICVLGQDPFGALLDQAIKGQQVEEHPIVVRRMDKAARGSGCHLIYLGRADAQLVADTLMVTRGEPVLTVSDQAAGTTGGVIHFVLLEGRVRFEIDPARAAANTIGVSSKLLSLAVGRTR